MTALTPQAFVAKWRHVELKERSACQEHFIDLCRLINHPTPLDLGNDDTLCVAATGAEFGTDESGIRPPPRPLSALNTTLHCGMSFSLEM